MGMYASVERFYGVCFEQDSEESERFVNDEDEDEDVVGSPAWCLTNASPYDPPHEGLNFSTFGHVDCPGYFIMIAGTRQRGDDWAPLALKPLTLQDDAPLKAYCAKWNLAFEEAHWFVVPNYG